MGPGCCLASESTTRRNRGLCHVCQDGDPEHGKIGKRNPFTWAPYSLAGGVCVHTSREQGVGVSSDSIGDVTGTFAGFWRWAPSRQLVSAADAGMPDCPLVRDGPGSAHFSAVAAYIGASHSAGGLYPGPFRCAGIYNGAAIGMDEIGGLLSTSSGISKGDLDEGIPGAISDRWKCGDAHVPGIDVPELPSQPLKDFSNLVAGIDVPEMVARPAMSALKGLGFSTLSGGNPNTSANGIEGVTSYACQNRDQ